MASSALAERVSGFDYALSLSIGLKVVVPIFQSGIFWSH